MFKGGYGFKVLPHENVITVEQGTIVFDFLEDYVFLSSVEVHESFRGKGHGKAMLNHFIAQIEKNIVITVIEESLVKWYVDELGFRVWSTKRGKDGEFKGAKLVREYQPNK